MFKIYMIYFPRTAVLLKGEVTFLDNEIMYYNNFFERKGLENEEK